MSETKEHHRERSRIYYSQNRERILARSKVWREKNKERYYHAINEWAKKHPERRKLSQIKYLKNNPDRRKTTEINSCVRFIEKRLEMDIEYFYNSKSKDEKSRFRRLTKLLFDDVIPKCCELCGSLDNLQIHHKRYDYPILRENIIRVCDPCHQKVHGKKVLTGKSIKEIQNEKYHTRRKFRDILPSYCEICGSTERLHIHHTSYPIIDTVDNLMRLCVSCHQKKHRNHVILNEQVIA